MIEKRERRGDEPGARFSTWEIWSQRLDDAPTSEVSYLAEGDEGKASQPFGAIYLDAKARRILVRPYADARVTDIKWLVERAHKERLSGDLNADEMSIAEMELEDQPVFAEAFARTWHVVRCSQPGCDTFGFWHRRDLSSLDKCEKHVACDRSTNAFRCRLLLQDGAWVPDIGPRAGMKDDPVDRAEELAFCLLDIASEARRLNGALFTGQTG
jgi:hypothetical protein